MATPAVSPTTGTTASVTTSPPGGIAIGDRAWIVVTHASASATITTPPNWTKLQESSTAADFTSILYERTGGWQSGDTAPSMTLSAAALWAADFISLADTNLSVATVSNQAVAAAVNSLACAVTPTAANSYILNHAQVDATGAARTWTSTAGTEFLDQMNNEQHRGAYWRQLSGGSGVSQSTTLTVSGTAQDVAHFAWTAAPAAAGGGGFDVPLLRRPRLYEQLLPT